MQRLPAVNPGDTTKYPNGIGTFDVGAADEGSKILFYNESPINLDLDFLNGSTDVLHAWEANYWTLDADTKQIEWEIDADSLNVTTPPVSAVFMTLYGPQEKLSGTFPMALIRQASVGNVGGIPTTNTNQVINDGNTLQEVIEATLLGHSTSDVIINNDGSFTLKGSGLLAAAGVLTHILGTLTVDQAVTLAAAGVLTHILGTLTVDQAVTLAAAGILTHILGTLTVDQAATFAAALTANSSIAANGAGTGLAVAHNATVGGTLGVTGVTTHTGNIIANGGENINDIRDNQTGAHQIGLATAGVTFDNEITVNNIAGKAAQALLLDVPTGQQLQANIGGVNFLSMSTGNFHVDNLGVVCSNIQPGGTRLNAITFGHVASATATVTHGLGGTPSSVIITPDIAQPGSATVGVGNVGATTFDAHIGAGTAFYWVAMR